MYCVCVFEYFISENLRICHLNSRRMGINPSQNGCPGYDTKLCRGNEW